MRGRIVTGYQTIVADPPWQYTKADLQSYARGAAEGHYDTESVSAIARIPLGELAADDAHLFMWVTNPVLTEQRCDASPLSVVRAWGFEPKTVLTWVKPDGGPGWYFRGNTEHVIYAVRGKAGIPAALRESNVFTAPRQGHSVKPDCFYDKVERVCPGPYMEAFARRARFGWDYWGDQSLGTAVLAS
jgi:N6-adenosine-specific RNA methylase IME4